MAAEDTVGAGTAAGDTTMEVTGMEEGDGMAADSTGPVISAIPIITADTMAMATMVAAITPDTMADISQLRLPGLPVWERDPWRLLCRRN